GPRQPGHPDRGVGQGDDHPGGHRQSGRGTRFDRVAVHRLIPFGWACGGVLRLGLASGGDGAAEGAGRVAGGLAAACATQVVEPQVATVAGWWQVGLSHGSIRTPLRWYQTLRATGSTWWGASPGSGRWGIGWPSMVIVHSSGRPPAGLVWLSTTCR